MDILKFKPLLQEKVWGGNRLKELLNKGESQTNPIGESWEISDNDAGETKVWGGPFDGQSFSQVLAENRKLILGAQSALYPNKFPLLFKYIDASDNLSVQVHPGDNSPLGDAKTETWYVVDAPPHAEIIVGISSKLPESEILEKLKTRDATSVLNHIPVATGDVLLIPAGTVHAITKGLVIYEVQQNSDTTFRLYDWGRLGNDGKPRDLHLKEAEQVLDFSVHQKHKIPPVVIHKKNVTESYLVVTKYFSLVKYSGIQGSFVYEMKNKFEVFTCLKGEFLLKSNTEEIPMKLGDTVMITANCAMLEIKVVQGEGEFISCYVPEIEKDIIAPLQTQGVSMDNIEALSGRMKLSW